MEFVCPNCKTPLGEVPDERFRDSRAEVDCPACGIRVNVDRRSGDAHPVPSAETDRGISPYTTAPPVSEMSGIKPKDRDIAPVIVLIVALLILSGGAYYVMKRIHLDALYESTPSISDMIGGLTRDVKTFLEKQGLLKGKKNRTAVRHLRRGYAHFEKNRFTDALEEFDRAVQIDPNNPDAYYWRARTLIKGQQYDRAAEDLRKAVDLNPRFAAAYDTLAWMNLQQGDWDKGIAWLDRSIELKPDNGWAYYNRGYMYRQKGDLKRARDDADKACQRNYEEGCRLLRELNQSVDSPEQGGESL